MALPFEAGGFGTQADYGFVSAMDLHKPQFDNELGRRYGNQYLSEFLMNINYAKPVMGYEYFHFEEGRIYPKLNASNGGAGSAGAAAARCRPFRRRPSRHAAAAERCVRLRGRLRRR